MALATLQLRPTSEELLALSRRRRTRNPDFIKGINYPLQTYAWSGAQWGTSGEAKAGKRPTDASPMIISSQPPGAFAKNDTSWALTFGASHDCVLSLFNGSMFFQNLSAMTLKENSVFRRSIGNADFNIYEHVGDVQQIQYVVSGPTAAAGRAAIENYGNVLNEARGLSMRTPLMAAGWGRTIGMRPTDEDPTEKRDNDDEHKLARETWKHGPVDLRWDARRGVWGAWNDLITDRNGQDLGTLVFDTNSDDTCGFPFLKGRLEDVWKVIISDAGAPVGDESDTSKSGDVATHLEHKWAELDDGTWQWAALSSTFKIHRAETSSGKCGSETFQAAPHIEIKTSTFFHLNDTFDGPMCFTIEKIKDEDMTGCMKFNGDIWIPAIPFDPCDRVGLELGILFDNDKQIAAALIEACNLLLKCLGKAGGGVDPESAEKAGESSDIAADAAGEASDAIGDINGGAPLTAGDSLATGNAPLTANGANAMNDAISNAEASYLAADLAQSAAADAARAAGDAAQAAADAAATLGEANSNAADAQNAADAAATRASELGGDDSGANEAAAKTDAAAKAAQSAKSQAQSDFNEASETANDTQQTAQDAHADAVEASDDASADRAQLEDTANQNDQDLPEDVKNKMDEADEAAKKAEQERRDAGLEEEPPPLDERVAEIEDCCDDTDCCPCCDDALVAVGQGMNDVAQGVGESVQKLANEIIDSVNDIVSQTMDIINTALGETSIGSELGIDSETGTGGMVAPVIDAAPPLCPPAGTRTRDPKGENPTDPGTPPQSGDPPTGDPPKSKPRGGGGDPPEGQPPDGPGTRTRDKPGGGPPPEPPPTCPIIVIKDPCNRGEGGTVTFGPGTAGAGSGSPQGTPPEVPGDPGEPTNNPDGGVEKGGPNDGQVIPPAPKTPSGPFGPGTG